MNATEQSNFMVVFVDDWTEPDSAFFDGFPIENALTGEQLNFVRVEKDRLLLSRFPINAELDGEMATAFNTSWNKYKEELMGRNWFKIDQNVIDWLVRFGPFLIFRLFNFASYLVKKM